MTKFALISTKAPGPAIRRQEFSEAPNPNAAKGVKWIADNPPLFNPEKETLAEPQEIPVDSTEVPYAVSDIPLATVKANRKAALRAKFESCGAALVSGYAPTERESWPEQVIAAQNFDPNGENQFLSAMTKEGETVADLATLILSNRSAYLSASAALIKNRRVIEAAIEAGETADDVLAVDIGSGWPT